MISSWQKPKKALADFVLNSRYPSSEITFRIALVINGLGALLMFVATLVHYNQTAPHPMSLFLPPFMFLVFFSSLLVLLRWPTAVEAVFSVVFASLLAVMTFASWWTFIEAEFFGGEPVIDALPPISAGLFVLTTSMLIFMRPEKVVSRALICWIVVSLPVLIYIARNHEVLYQMRGLDLFLLFGPAALVNIVILRFIVHVWENMNQVHNQAQQFKALSERDDLTGVFNRRVGDSVLEHYLRGAEVGRNIGLIFFDVDNLKAINDKFGHINGDRVLWQTGICVSRCVRNTDYVIRWGGDEFLIILMDAGEHEIRNISEYLRSTLNARDVPPVGKISASFGATRLHPGETLQMLFGRIDGAMYQAKHQGRNTVVYQP
jgi:diguanylate cyclase